MKRLLIGFGLVVLGGCGIKGPPRPPTNAPPPPPLQSQSQTPINQESSALDAGCSSCANKQP